MRVLSTLSNQVPVVARARPRAISSTRRRSPARTPSARNFRSNARRALGSAATSDMTNAKTSRPGSLVYPSLQSRHIAASAGGIGTSGRRATPGMALSGEDIVGRPFLVGGRREATRLQLEHLAVAPAQRQQLVVAAEFDHPAMLQDGDAVGVPHRREAVRDQD